MTEREKLLQATPSQQTHNTMSSTWRAFLESPMAEAVTKTPVIRAEASASDDDAGTTRDRENGGAPAHGTAAGGGSPPVQRSASAAAAAAFVRAVDRPFFLLH